MDPKKRLVIFIQPFGPIFSIAIQKMMDQSEVQLSASSSTLEAASLARRAVCCLLICYVDREEILNKFLNMHKMLFQRIREGGVRLLVTSSLKDEGSKKRLRNLLGTEVLSEPVTEKTLLFKINRLLQLLPPPSSVPTRNSSTAGRTTTVKENVESSLKMVSPLELESDCWQLVPNEAKFLGGRWIIKFKGPDPSRGRWFSIQSNLKDHQAWQWIPTPDSTDIREEGAWVFQGEKPEMRDGSWTFMGKRPNLSFFRGSTSLGARLSIDLSGGASGKLLIAADPNRAIKAQGDGTTSSEKSEEGGNSSKGHFEWADPLIIDSDCWLFQRRVPKRSANKWVATLLGPSPIAGRWVSVEASEKKGPPSAEGQDRWWCWVPSDPDRDPFIQEEGGWVFHGQLPKYVDGFWVFAAQKPQLSFYYNGDSYGDKLLVDDSAVLRVARDSEVAEKLAPMLKASEDSMVTVLKQEAGNYKESSQNASENQMSFRFAPDYFSPAGGEWESAGTGSQGRRWFLYLPYEVLNSAVSPDVRRWGLYWLYFGPTSPKLETKSEKEAWTFLERKPQSFKVFSDLPKEIKNFIFEYFPGEGHGGKIGKGERRIPCKVFGKTEGGWEYVGDGSQGRRWYVYIPLEILEGLAGDIRKQSRYWAYLGPSDPRTEAGANGPEFVFEERDPQSFMNFGELPKSAQEFLKLHFGGAPTEAAEGTPEEIVRGFDEGFIPVLKEGRPSESAPSGETEAEVEAFDPGGLAADFLDPFLEKTSEQTDIIQKREGDEAIIRYPVEMIGTPGGIWEVVDGANPENRLYLYIAREILDHLVDGPQGLASYWTYRGKELPNIVNEGGKKYWNFRQNHPEGFGNFGEVDDASKNLLLKYFKSETPSSVEAVKEGGVAAIQAMLEPGTTLSPLSIAFLMSELMRNKSLEHKLVGRRFCDYLGAALGIRVELWVISGDTWFCGGASQDGEGKHGGILRSGSGLQYGMSPEGIFIAPVFADSRLGSRKVTGALLFETTAPDRPTKEYAGFVARIARGLLLTLSGADQKTLAA